ncbi:MAG: hypothetical protein A3C53_06060 [Omnitrophica WOR_2 bacterium RIFCSPHIGHO2_02_FULL_68_15]|nr:MAG: hypothetical protein A3C53_06060 [Omnitrophica WOR_2 bacterium RIFCSPHIGHO2_02_FULL_68_15]
MVQSIVKLQKNKNITLPMWLIRRFRIAAGDFVRLQETREGILLKPGKLIDPSQAYFWTKEWQQGEREVEEERRQGKVKRFRSMKELVKDLDR